MLSVQLCKIPFTYLFWYIKDVLSYANSSKWYDLEISGVVTQITDLGFLFDTKFIKVIQEYWNI